MNPLLHKFRAALTLRQQTAVMVLVATVITLLYGWLMLSAGQARTRLQATVTLLQAQAAQLEQQRLEYARLRATPAPSAAPADLRTLVQSQADEAGLSAALVKIDALDRNRVQVTFGAVAFADWLAWLRTLQNQQARVETCRIEALSTAGLVSITALLTRVQPQ